MFEMSQSELTQGDFATQIDTYYSQAGNELDDPSQETGPEPWLRLVSLHSSVPVRELFPKKASEAGNTDSSSASTNPDAPAGQLQSLYSRVIDTSPKRSGTKEREERLHEYVCGRSMKSADIRFESAKVSNVHCKLFLRRVYSGRHEYQLVPFVLDVSANGTYVDRTTKIPKNEPRRLRSGDVISLIDFNLLNNVRLAPAEKRALKEEIERQSFIVLIPGAAAAAAGARQPEPARPAAVGSLLLDDELDDPAVLDSSRTAAQPQASAEAGIHRESTVFRMVKQQRNISDHYVMVRHIGSGGCGLVFEGVNKYSGVPFAIKKMDLRQFILANMPKGRGGGSAADRQAQLAALRDQATRDLLREAELMRAIRHERIIHFEDAFADDSYLYLVLELVTGGDLFDRLQRKGVYKEGEAKHVITALLQAISLLHSKNIAHRDIKPENILLTSRHSDVDIKLTDFGLAKQIKDNARLKTYCGTPQYFAPEVYKAHAQQAQGPAQGVVDSYTLAADMWSIGVLLFVLLSSTYPFPELPPQQVPMDMLRARFSFAGAAWQAVSVPCRDFIRALLVPDAEARLTATQALQHPWITTDPAPILGRSQGQGSEQMPQGQEPEQSQAQSQMNLVQSQSDSQSPTAVTALPSHTENSQSQQSSMDVCSLELGRINSQGVPTEHQVPAQPAESVTAALIQNINAHMRLGGQAPAAGPTESPQRAISRKRKGFEQSPPRADVTASNTASNAHCGIAGSIVGAAAAPNPNPASATESSSRGAVTPSDKPKRQKQVKIMEMFSPKAEASAAPSPALVRRTSTRQRAAAAAAAPEAAVASAFVSPAKTTTPNKAAPKAKAAPKVAPAKGGRSASARGVAKKK